MSNIGKTYWSKKLEKVGFKRFGCDDMIEKKLDKQLRNTGLNGIKDVDRWLGQPFEPQYQRNSNKYLNIEKSIMLEVLDSLRYHVSKHSNIVIDTTGGVIYTGDSILRELTQQTTIVYLESSVEQQREMYERYLREPKPVIWGKSYKKKNGESNMDALRMCYPNLLQYRFSHYKRWAKVTIESATIREAHFDTHQFLQLLPHLDYRI